LLHEGYHGFTIRHTFKDSGPIGINQKFIFQSDQDTINIMSYGTQVTSWHWQWKLANPKIK